MSKQVKYICNMCKSYYDNVQVAGFIFTNEMNTGHLVLPQYSKNHICQGCLKDIVNLVLPQDLEDHIYQDSLTSIQLCGNDTSVFRNCDGST